MTVLNDSRIMIDKWRCVGGGHSVVCRSMPLNRRSMRNNVFCAAEYSVLLACEG